MRPMPQTNIEESKAIVFETLTENGKYLQVNMKSKSSNIYVTFSKEKTAVYKTLLTVILSPLNYWVGRVDSPFLEKDKRRQPNSMLVNHRTNRYMYLGSQVYAFRIDDVIDKFVSPEGGNKIPFAIAFGKEYIYFLTTRTCVKYSVILKLDETVTPEVFKRKIYGIRRKNALDIYKEYYDKLYSGEWEVEKINVESRML
tara:strand:+ start:304 stop:900 length:597 start_codon:yes stop_codon:yes gene_type:complete